MAIKHDKVSTDPYYSRVMEALIAVAEDEKAKIEDRVQAAAAMARMIELRSQLEEQREVIDELHKLISEHGGNISTKKAEGILTKLIG